eukprot:1184591-Alexandrium_andersonii.AAC.1
MPPLGGDGSRQGDDTGGGGVGDLEGHPEVGSSTRGRSSRCAPGGDEQLGPKARPAAWFERGRIGPERSAARGGAAGALGAAPAALTRVHAAGVRQAGSARAFFDYWRLAGARCQ